MYIGTRQILCIQGKFLYGVHTGAMIVLFSSFKPASRPVLKLTAAKALFCYVLTSVSAVICSKLVTKGMSGSVANSSNPIF